MNIVRAFANHLQTSGVATLDTDMFISRAPSSREFNLDDDPIPEAIWWLVGGGGSKIGKFRNHIIEVYYRSRNAEDVYEQLSQLADDIDCDGCLTLEGFEVTEVTTNGPFTDDDLDSEERTVGLLQITITTFKGEC